VEKWHKITMAHWLTVAVNGEQEKEMEDQLSDGDEVLVFAGVRGG